MKSHLRRTQAASLTSSSPSHLRRFAGRPVGQSVGTVGREEYIERLERSSITAAPDTQNLHEPTGRGQQRVKSAGTENVPKVSGAH